jgi:shikimate dehydrogenase
MKLLGLIGFPLTHSRSPQLFQQFFQNESLQNWDYRLFPLEDIIKLPELLQAESGLCGLNVTVPYKTMVLPFLNELSPEAAQICAVNTITIQNIEGKKWLKGYNTDVAGFLALIGDIALPQDSEALILGTGGSSKAVAFALTQIGIPYTLVSRIPIETQLGYRNLDKDSIEKHKLIINTTPIGMWPNTAVYPEIPYEFIGPSHICIDLIYNPEMTLFLSLAQEKGALVKNGSKMLAKQAEKAWELFKLATTNPV